MTKPILATLLAGLLIVSAQQNQQQNQVLIPTGGVGKISTTVQLVVVDLAAKDKNGNPIEGLTAKDFTITEDGKPQDIKIFKFQKLEEEMLPEPQLGARPQVASQPAAPAAPVVKSVTANQISAAKPGEIKYQDRRLMVLFFDMTSMPIQDQIRAETAAMKFLKTQMTKSDLVAVMSFSSDLNLLKDFTDDRDELIKTVKNLSIGEGSDLAVAGSTGADDEEDTGAAFQQDDTEFNIFNTDRKLAALENAARMLGSLSEKKALIYFASGVDKTGAENEAQLRATINAAIRNNVSFWPIDARGLVASAPLGDATKASPGGTNMLGGSSARTAQGRFQSQQETLYTLAEDTGGKALLDSNDLALGIQAAQKAEASYYILGYYSTNDKPDGKFRTIKITPSATLSARLGKKLDYRPGYFANKQFQKFNSSDKERQLEEALTLGDPMTDLTVALEVDYFRRARDRYFVPVTVKIPGGEFELAKHGGAESTKIDWIGEVKNAKGQVETNVRDESEVKLKGETVTQLAKRNVAYTTGFTLAPGTYTLKMLARENTTGKMGTFQTKFTVPDLTTEQKRLPISAVVLSNERQDLSAAVFNAEHDRRLFDSDPLVQEKKRLIPSVTRVFRKDSEMFVYLEAYQPTAQSTQPLVASVGFYRGKVKAFETAPLEVTDGLTSAKAVPVKFSVPLAKLQPGKYECQVSVFDPTAQKFNFWRAPVVVLP
jgi:VWFA-related protein